MSYYEINEVMEMYNFKSIYDEVAGVNYFAYALYFLRVIFN